MNILSFVWFDYERLTCTVIGKLNGTEPLLSSTFSCFGTPELLCNQVCLQIVEFIIKHVLCVKIQHSISLWNVSQQHKPAFPHYMARGSGCSLCGICPLCPASFTSPSGGTLLLSVCLIKLQRKTRWHKNRRAISRVPPSSNLWTAKEGQRWRWWWRIRVVLQGSAVALCLPGDWLLQETPLDLLQNREHKKSVLFKGFQKAFLVD